MFLAPSPAGPLEGQRRWPKGYVRGTCPPRAYYECMSELPGASSLARLPWRPFWGCPPGEMPPSTLRVDVSPAVLCPASLQACSATMFQCVHFWGWKSLESSFGHSNDSINDQMTVFQTNMCSVLVRRPRGDKVGLMTLCLPFTMKHPMGQCKDTHIDFSNCHNQRVKRQKLILMIEFFSPKELDYDHFDM